MLYYHTSEGVVYVTKPTLTANLRTSDIPYVYIAGIKEHWGIPAVFRLYTFI